jgi:kynureninase
MTLIPGAAKPVPAEILRADADDPLAPFRERFSLPADLIYLDGNSLGALPRATPARLAAATTEEWGRGLITSWNAHDWISAPQRVGDKIAHLLGADAGEVVITDSTSVNLFKLLGAALDHQSGRSTILSEPGNFPTDLYIAQGAARVFQGCSLRLLPADEIVSAIDDDTAVVLLTHVHYKSGRKLDMAAITAAAHAKGALVLWDLSHSAGAIALDLKGCDVDLAVGCGYKYLNGGPGAPAFVFVAGRLQAALRSPLTGWMGHAAGFEFRDDYEPAKGVGRFLCGTPPILAITALEVGVDLMLEASPKDLVHKAEALSDLFIDRVQSDCPDLVLVSPREFENRGSHVSFAHPKAYEICQALIARGVVGDFRSPDVARFGFTPLYIGFADVWRAASILAEVMATGAWADPAYSIRNAVT